MRANSFNTGIASEYLILSKLYRQELEAYVSLGNKKSVDIRVIRENGNPISIDVKSVRGYSSLVVNNVEPNFDHFLVFVIYNNKFNDLNVEPDIFIVPSDELASITETYGQEKRVMKGSLGNYRNAWHYISDGNGDDGMHTLEELDEIDNQRTLDNWNKVLKLRKSGLNNEEICSELELTADQLTDLEVDYHNLTGN
tara:strand:+ start:66 stop:656 length:591 start_codon:yes stop_codon:yes gene_type:complete